MDALELELAKRDRPLPTEEVVEAVRLNALGYVWIEVWPPLVLEVERPNFLPCEGGGHRDGERPDEKQGQRESRSDHEDYHLQPEKIGS